MAYSFIDTLFANGDDMDPSPFWVLMALCWFVNEKKATSTTCACWPSIKKIAAKAHVSELTARKSIKVLMEKKFITAHQPPGKVRVFYVDFSRIKELAGGKDLEGVKDVSGVKDLEGDPLKMLKGRGERSLPPPLKDLEAEQGIEQGIEQGRVAHACASAVATTPPVVDDEAEAEWNDLTARAALEADSMPEDVFSPDAQIPIENIDARFATASDSIFGTDTPPKDQNAAERKSEAISKPKRKRVSSSVVKDKPEDISQEVWDDWLTTRRAKRLPLTQTALNSVRREAASAGLTFQAAVTFAVEQGWAAFRAEWYRNATRKGDSTKTNARYLTAQERYEERMRKAGEMSDEEYFAQFDLPEEILNYEKAQEAKRHVAS